MPKVGDTVFYSDPVNDEFSGFTRPKVTVDGRFRFLREGKLYRAVKFFVYRCVITPFAFLYCKLKFRLRMRGAEKLKQVKSGYFLYANHTQAPGDGLLANVATFPRETHIVVHPDNIALKGTRTVMQMLGALPIPTTRDGFPPFQKAVSHHIAKGRCVAVFPEAHIWPYATVIRPFSAVSFRYPVAENVPAFALTVTYRRRKNGKPQMVAFVDGPFYGEGDTAKQKQQTLRDAVYTAMKARADSDDNVAFIRYVEAKT